MALDGTDPPTNRPEQPDDHTRLELLETIAAEHEEELHRLRATFAKFAGVALDAARLPGPTGENGVQVDQNTFLVGPE